MRSVLVVDTEKSWCKFCSGELGLHVSSEVLPGYDIILLSSRKLHLADRISTKFVVTTSYMTLQESLKAHNAGASDYIAKNLDPDWFAKYLSIL